MSTEKDVFEDVEFGELEIEIDGGFLRSTVRVYVGDELLKEETVAFYERLKIAYGGATD